MKRSFAGSWDCTRNLCRSVSQFVNLAGLREDETWTGPWAVHARRELFSRQSWTKTGELRISGVLMRCICKMCTLYVQSAYYYIKTQQAKGNVEMTDEQRNVYIYIIIYMCKLYIYAYEIYLYCKSKRAKR